MRSDNAFGVVTVYLQAYDLARSRIGFLLGAERPVSPISPEMRLTIRSLSL